MLDLLKSVAALLADLLDVDDDDRRARKMRQAPGYAHDPDYWVSKVREHGAGPNRRFLARHAPDLLPALDEAERRIKRDAPKGEGE